MSRDVAASAPRPLIRGGRMACAPYAAFAAFGIFWGAWGAGLPALRTQAGASDGQLGTALLFIAVGALPSMIFTGWAVDRFGLRLSSWLLAALAGAGLLVVAGAHRMAPLVFGMLVVGAASGATDVAINTLAGRSEHATTKSVLTRSHGMFSVGVVVASLSTGALLSAGLSLPAVFAVVAVVMLALATFTLGTSASLQVVAHQEPASALTDHAQAAAVADHGGRPTSDQSTMGMPLDAQKPMDLRSRISVNSPLLVVGLVAALAYAVENAHQSWGAVMLTDVFAASPQTAAAAPAAFAGTAALARLSLAPLSRSHPTAMLVGGGTVATAGSAMLATAPSVAVALVGLVLAALGTATLFPTLLSSGLRGTDPAQQGRTTSTVATTAYLGFLLGPAYVGLLAENIDLRGAMVGVGALALVFTAAAAPISVWAATRVLTRQVDPLD